MYKYPILFFIVTHNQSPTTPQSPPPIKTVSVDYCRLGKSSLGLWTDVDEKYNIQQVAHELLLTTISTYIFESRKRTNAKKYVFFPI